MKKNRILALLLVVVMLLGMIPGAVFAATPEIKVSLTLTDSIAINFKVAADDMDAAAFERMEFYNGETLLDTVTELPAVDGNGMYVFSYTDIAPHMMGYTVTAKLYAGDLNLEQDASVLAYCSAILNNAATYGEKLSVLAMELLDYGAATQKYYAAVEGTAVADTDLVNYGIAEAYPDIYALCNNEALTYSSVKSVGSELETPAVVWTGIGLYLHDAISIRYKFTAQSVEGLTMMAISGENSWAVTDFYSAGDGVWYAYFDGLNPARMRDTVVAIMYDSQNEMVSNILSYSIESYVTNISAATTNETLKTLVQEMLRYGDACADWAQTPPEDEPVVTWEALAQLDFEGTEFPMTQNSTYTLGDFGTPGYNSDQALCLDGGEQAKYSQSATVPAGDYRISGYVKLGDATPGSIAITYWTYKAASATATTTMENAIVGEADENGWSYFVIDFRHEANYTATPFIVKNNGSATVYFDDIVYAKRVEEEIVETEPVETEPAETEPAETEPEVNMTWEALAELDFEGTEFPMTQNSTYTLGDFGTPGYNSDQALCLDGGEQAKYSQSATVPAGDYRISGYVKLGDATPGSIAITYWTYKAASATATMTMENAIVGEADENGWSYFAIDFRHEADYTATPFIVKNNGSATVYFDDIVYAKGEEIEEEEPEVVWGDMIEILDFEQGVLEPLTVQAGAPQVTTTSRPVENGQSLRLESKEQAKYSQSATLKAGWYRLSGYVKLGDASAANAALTVWAYTGTTTGNSQEKTMANAIVGDADEYGWSYFAFDFEHKANYTLIQFIAKNYGTETVYFDDITYAKYTGDGQPATDAAQTAFETLRKLDFEGTQFPMVQNSSYTLGDFGTPGYGSSQVLQLNTGDRAKYYNNALTQTADDSYKLTGWFKKENPDTVVSVTYWYRIAGGENDTAVVQLKDAYIVDASGDWQYFEIPVAHLGTTTLVQFILNNHSSTGAAAGCVWFDDIRYMRAFDENDLLALQWQEQLEAEEQESMMVQDQLDDPYVERVPLGENLIANGDFSAETDLLLMDKEVKANATGWTTIDRNTYDTYSKITADGTFYGEAPVGYNDPQVYNRPVPQLHQKISGIIPGAVYQIKFRYKIEASNDSSPSWYGPYVALNTGDSSATLAADKAPGGLVTTGQWQWFTQTVVMNTQNNYVNLDLCMWLYEGDWCEVDDVQFYLVSYGDHMALDLETKFFYTDMGTTTFTADLMEENYSDIAADTGAAVKFEVFNGQTLVWNSEKMALTGEGYTAQADFALSNMTELGAPYVVKATLYDGDGEVLFETSEQIFIYDRPTSLDTDGNFIKKTPSGNDLDFNMAYAILQKDYEKTKEIGCNVMSLSNAKSAEQVLKLLDYCYEYGYMGFLNMNWGLYNEDDINQKRWVLIDVASDERIRNHPSMLGYCLADEPWSWGSEAHVAANLEEGYRLIREYDTQNVIFSVDNMTQFHDQTVKYSDVLFVDHYDAPTGGTIYNKVSTAIEAASGRMPVWTALGAYKQVEYYPTADQVRNEIWQAFMAGADGVGYYAISYSDYDENGDPVSIWDVVDSDGNNIGQDTWDGLVSFKEKEWDIAFDRFADGKGQTFNEKIDIDKGYMYSSWVDENGDLYFIVLNVSSSLKFVTLPMTSDNGQVSFSGFTSTVINGGDPSSYTIGKNLYVWLDGYQAVLYKITPNNDVDFSVLG